MCYVLVWAAELRLLCDMCELRVPEMRRYWKSGGFAAALHICWNSQSRLTGGEDLLNRLGLGPGAFAAQEVGLTACACES